MVGRLVKGAPAVALARADGLLTPDAHRGAVPYRVFKIKNTDRAKLDEALGDDILSRQSLQVRDAAHFGHKADSVYLFVEGEEKGMLRAEAVILAFGERAPDADALYKALKDEEESAASSLGSVFDGL